MNRFAPVVLQRVVAAWSDALMNLRRMGGATAIRPTNAYDIFELDATARDDEVKITIKPVVFHVTERPNRAAADLYIVVQGRLAFELPADSGDLLRTRDFATQVAYFRAKPNKLEHVYGAHYDMDEKRPGHPVFHAQMSSQCAFSGSIAKEFRQHERQVDDCIRQVLGTVRTPSAQMDIFSVVTQIGADHLLGEGVAPVVRAAFSGLRRSCDILVGAAYRLPYLNKHGPSHCYRATHWYDSPEANADPPARAG